MPHYTTCRSFCGTQQPDRIAVTRPGLFEAVPDLRLSLLAPQPQVQSALTGPDGGVTNLKRKLAGTAGGIEWVRQADALVWRVLALNVSAAAAALQHTPVQNNAVRVVCASSSGSCYCALQVPQVLCTQMCAPFCSGCTNPAAR
jgi:hypothetical protein